MFKSKSLQEQYNNIELKSPLVSQSPVRTALWQNENFCRWTRVL